MKTMMSKTRKTLLKWSWGKKIVGCLKKLQFAYNFHASFLVLIVYVRLKYIKWLNTEWFKASQTNILFYLYFGKYIWSVESLS